MEQVIEKHYTPKELSKLLGISIPLLTYLRRTGRGPKFIKFGSRSIIYGETEVKKFLQQQERLSTSDNKPRRLNEHANQQLRKG